MSPSGCNNFGDPLTFPALGQNVTLLKALDMSKSVCLHNAQHCQRADTGIKPRGQI